MTNLQISLPYLDEEVTRYEHHLIIKLEDGDTVNSFMAEFLNRRNISEDDYELYRFYFINANYEEIDFEGLPDINFTLMARF